VSTVQNQPLVINHLFSTQFISSYLGLFIGFFYFAATITSITLFYIFSNQSTALVVGESAPSYVVAITELVLFPVATVACIIAIWCMRSLQYVGDRFDEMMVGCYME
jgi:hypothetical protein